MAGLGYLFAVLRNRHERLQECRTWRGHRLRIESDAEVPYELDGDPGGFLPVEIETLPGRIRMIVSPTWAPAVPGEAIVN